MIRNLARKRENCGKEMKTKGNCNLWARQRG